MHLLCLAAVLRDIYIGDMLFKSGLSVVSISSRYREVSLNLSTRSNILDL